MFDDMFPGMNAIKIDSIALDVSFRVRYGNKQTIVDAGFVEG